MPKIASVKRASLSIIALLSMFGPAHAEQSRLPDCPAFRRILKWNDCIGSAQLPTGEKYEGEFRADKPNGQGTSTQQDGSKYTGAWKDGQRHGKGQLILPSGERYVGEFRNDKQNGEGASSLQDGTKYSGAWKDGQRHGKGQLIFPHGAKYVGDFSYGAQTGMGTYTWPNGEKYVGEIANGYRNGIGTFTWKDGRKYTGHFNSDQRNGSGTLTWPNGRKYVGEFRFSSFNGEGVLYDRDGSVIQKGEWKDDKFCGAEKCYSLSLLPPVERELAEIEALTEKGIITYSETWRRTQKTNAKYNLMNSQPDKEFFAVAIEAGSRLDKGIISKEQYDVEIQRAITKKEIQQRQISAAENAKAAVQRQLEQNRINADMIRQQNEAMIRQQNEQIVHQQDQARRDSAIRALGIAGGLAQPTVVAPPASNTLPLGVPHNYNINGKPITCTNMGAVTNCQ